MRTDIDQLYQKFFKYKTAARWVFVVIVAITVIALYKLEAFSRIELITLDYRFSLKPHKAAHSDIVFIDMAEDSIDAIGRWPWPRRWHATLTKALSEYGPRAIIFDVLFSEPQDETDDALFAEAIKQSGVTYLPLLYDLDPGMIGYAYNGDGVKSVTGPIPELREYIIGTGHINAYPDHDGILRRVPAVIGYGGKTTYNLGLAAGCNIMGLAGNDVVFYPEKHSILLKVPGSGNISVPLDKDNQIILNWKGKWGADFRHFSYIDVIKSYGLIRDGKPPIIDLNIFRDKICLIGLTAAGLVDIKPIPIQTDYPAVGVSATIINSVLNNDFIHEATDKVNISIIFLVSLVITLSFCNLRVLSGVFTAILSVIIYAVISTLIFIFFNVVVVTFYPMLAIVLSYLLAASYSQLSQSMERIYLVKEAARDPLTNLYNIRHFNLLLEAEFRNVSVYKLRPLAIIMLDIDNFKSINDSYGHPVGDAILKDMALILQTSCKQIDVVARYGGEEFIVMMVGAGEKAAFGAAERMREAIRRKRFKVGTVELKVTASFGVAEYSNEKSKEALVEKSDKALYVSKKSGKDMVTASSSILS